MSRISRVRHALLIGLAGCGGVQLTEEDRYLRPEELDFPLLISVECQSEVCYPGLWIACDSIPIVRSPLTPEMVVGWLSRNESFRMHGANVMVNVPGAIHITEDFQQSVGGGQSYSAGDTLYALDHRGEGFFTTWYRGGLTTTEIFWPWDRGGGWEIRGDVLQEAQTEFWVRAEGTGGADGWIRQDAERMLIGPIGRGESCESN